MSMPQAVRHINAIRAMEAIYRQGAISRASLARELGLTRSTIGNIVAEMVKDGSVIEVPGGDEAAQPVRTGRPGTLVRLRADHAAFIGADLGVGEMTVVAIDLEARTIATLHEAFSVTGLSPDRTIHRLFSLIRKMNNRVGSSHTLRGLCVTVPGVVDTAGTLVHLPMMGWRDVPLLPRLRAAFPDIPSLLVENDANAFAMAEHCRAASKLPSHMVHILMDAGVGGAFTVDGRLQRGFRGREGEIGHIPLGEKGFLDKTPLHGSLESYVGRDAILARHRFHGGRAKTLTELLERLAAGTEPANATLQDWALQLGRGLATVTALFDPGEIVLGGPVSVLFDYSSEAVRRSLERYLMPGRPSPQLRRSQLGADGTALGGAYLLHRRFMSLKNELVFHGLR